ncbi:MAG: Bax inhibitor-1/YccA family protein [Alphaproteobacteria bacterium]|jgi:hypothetical protein|nr:Bax inhibitor-1/YccA family protein [Alphaproteobacteria bacterium]
MNQFNRQAYQTSSQSRADIDVGLRDYMMSVYRYMGMGLAMTGAIAYLIFSLSVVEVNGQMMATSLGATLFNSPLKWVIMLAPLGVVFYLSARINAMSASTAQMAFWVYAALNGVSFATIFMVFTGMSIAKVFLITACMFGAMSVWGYTTKRDLTGMGSFLFMGLIGIVIASIVNIFLASDAMSFVISIVGVLVFTGLTAYDTQSIKEEYYAGDSSELAAKKAIMGALRLYLDFINLFIMMLQLFGNRE